LRLAKENNSKILGIETAKTRLITKVLFLGRIVAIKSLNAMVAKIMKVRPQDPSYMA
jgi:hypothetical protein